MMKSLALMGSAALCSLALMTPASAQFRAALNESKAAVDEGARSQQRVEELDQQATELLGDYRAAQKQAELLRRFNASRRREVENQLREIEGLEQDVENIEGLQQATLPLLEDMMNTLAAFVEADTPFLQTERMERIERLREVMADSTQTAASRYNLIVEAYQIENEYGRTLDSYKGVVTTDAGEELQVEFLRIGRLALIYKTADNSLLRIYDPKVGSFVDLDRSFMEDVVRGIRIANEQLPPDLMTIPVSAPISGDSDAAAPVVTAPAEEMVEEADQEATTDEEAAQ
ncbi:hypothetical protein PB2503_06452 [Parvularcula bermudensis HTCC2503]|uniref:DUF3450 domain-containing protein n=1 Tax=Parvularcula bermudensis (strain ATCC BAA-594 / HTCC2503 / KCTC 12087) TaxID=314260 RepID=E0THR0_PARBH|nr:DUF3450 domain-containing protein [Parvularcula bermudensis]ADM09356.1 hypothetical protein PB2503_06452 [Parvularcula bermudensis HTCC2503]